MVTNVSAGSQVTRRLTPNLVHTIITMTCIGVYSLVLRDSVKGFSSETNPYKSQALSPGFGANTRELGLGTRIEQEQ